VDDLIEGFLRLMQTLRGCTGPVNLGDPGEFTMIELAEAIRDLTGSRSELVHRPLPDRRPLATRSEAERRAVRLAPLPQGARMTTLHNPHDRFFKTVFGRTEAAAEFLERYRPPCRWCSTTARRGGG